MGYTTEISGHIAIDPPLSREERLYLTQFSGSRRMDRARGPYFVHGSGYAGQGPDADIRDHNNPPECQPGLWCQWAPSTDGAILKWNGAEKFYNGPEWMAYLRSHFITLGAAKILDPEHQGFWTPHRMSGEIIAVGEEPGSDVWMLVVNDDGVFTRPGSWTPDAQAILFGHDDDRKSDYVGPAKALKFILANPAAVTFGPPHAIDDFKLPGMKARILARNGLGGNDFQSPPRALAFHEPLPLSTTKI